MTEVCTKTESVCPQCLARIPAERVFEGQAVYLEKTCPEHGYFRTLIWRGDPEYQSWVRPKIPSYPEHPTSTVKDGCPYDCGLCPEHRQHTCSVLFEITQRCDLHCPVCFADAGIRDESDWSMEEIDNGYKRLLANGGPYNIQLSGGEPCMRDDLAEIIRIARGYGFEYIQLNTNGLRLAREPQYLAALKSAGLSSIFLQFDGTQDDIYRKIRGRALLKEKMALLENCRQLDVGVVLVPTLIPGINTQNIGQIISFAIEQIPTVRGVHFQPISYFGRYPQNPTEASRITLPEVIRFIEEQTAGMIQKKVFLPPGCENAHCSFHGNFVLMPDGILKSITLRNGNMCDCKPIMAAEGAVRSRAFVAQNWTAVREPVLKVQPNAGIRLGDWEVFLERKRTHSFCISAMAFQDAWTLELERLRDCCIHVAVRDGRLVPFCAYNLTDIQGKTLYRNACETYTA